MNVQRILPAVVWRALFVGLGSASLASSAHGTAVLTGASASPILAAGMVPAWFLVLVFGTMLVVVAIVLAVIGRLCLPKVPRTTIYALSPVISALLIFTFYWLKMVIGAASEEESRASYTQAQVQTAELIDLKAWWLVPNADNPQAMHLEIATRVSGQVRARVRMGSWPSESESQGRTFLMEQPEGATAKPVKAGELLGLDVPLLRLNDGTPQAIAITLYFTDLPPGAAALDRVTKCYANFAMEGLQYVQVQVALPPRADPKAWER